MARYNTTLSNSSLNGAATLSAPSQGLFTELTGSAPYQVTLPNPTLYNGIIQTYYNATSGTITLATPAGVFTGSNASSITLPTLSTIQVVSDGTNYVTLVGSAAAATITNLTVNTQAIINPSNSSSSMDNVVVGASTPRNGNFQTLTAGQGGTVVTLGSASIGTSGATLTITGGQNLALTGTGSTYNVTVPYPNLGQSSTPTAVANVRYVNSLLTTASYWARSW